MQPVGHRLIGYPPDRREGCVRRIADRSRGVVSFLPCRQYNWDIADRRFWIAGHRDCGNGRTGGLNLNQRCQRQMGFIMKVTTTIRLVG
ncbi:hypothetical protein F9C07_2567 [Aspergillus flavus]|uniref:Uncharacterized protein n=1 Tax=Aspergillus flavus (strain ATCC 200026 / FGSC A1120 / IAM 13836 / NRRL 3357 / JCM 12722 / SRRC 167) TaxID=332952 RepID=A0A7U2MF07_ASPFN|nr:hypothetical protein F9C07_2567 [Aspergillus flavus]